MANKPPQPRKTNQSDHINLDVVGGGDWTGPALVTAAADDGTADDDNDDDASFDLSTDAEWLWVVSGGLPDSDVTDSSGSEDIASLSCHNKRKTSVVCSSLM